ncbi:MAG: type II toxin-antitoxin system CcdA family antitoxin [Methanospirillum sp.]|nr:type II toxin-antitoxin system CcdA family antitoxin [Methanospirillum sp.]
MVNRKRRTTVSLDPLLLEQARAFGEQHGISVSSLIEEGLRTRLDGPPVAPPDLEALIDGRIRRLFPELLEIYLASPCGAELLERAIIIELKPPLSPEERDDEEVIETR